VPNGAYLPRFGDVRKNTPLHSWSMCLACCYVFLIFDNFDNIVAGFNVSQKDVCVATACGASETPTKKHVPGIVEHVPYVLFFVAFCDSSSPLRIGSGCPAAMSGSSQPLHRIRFGWATAMEARRHCDP
jgi:hypothetical protein